MDEAARLRAKHLLRTVYVESLRCYTDEISAARRVTLGTQNRASRAAATDLAGEKQNQAQERFY
jgi:hypothetical protein